MLLSCAILRDAAPFGGSALLGRAGGGQGARPVGGGRPTRQRRAQGGGTARGMTVGEPCGVGELASLGRRWLVLHLILKILQRAQKRQGQRCF